MSNMLQNTSVLGNMTNQVIATDFLLASKQAIKNYAWALAETASPQVRETLKRHLEVAINTHENITHYMMENKYYHAYNPQEQIANDMKAAQKVMALQAGE